jgi:hypothetical protein
VRGDDAEGFVKLSELIAQLLEIADERDTDPVVVAAYQPSYPLAGDVLGACTVESDDDDPDTGAPLAVWIVISDHATQRSPYAPREVFEKVDR